MAGGIRGRKPIPKVLHLLTNPNRHAKAKEHRDYPEPMGQLPEAAPAWLNFEAREEWDRVVGSMKATGVFTRVDLSALAQYCYWFGQFMKWAYFLEMEGPLAFSGTGSPMTHPYVPMVREASRKALEFAAHLGLTPAARMRLGQEKKENTDDPFTQHEAKAPQKRRPGRPRKQDTGS